MIPSAFLRIANRQWRIYDEYEQGGNKVERLEAIISMLDHALNTKKKRHIAGGILMSISLLFGGLSVTVLTLKTEDKKNE